MMLPQKAAKRFLETPQAVVPDADGRNRYIISNSSTFADPTCSWATSVELLLAEFFLELEQASQTPF